MKWFQAGNIFHLGTEHPGMHGHPMQFVIIEAVNAFFTQHLDQSVVVAVEQQLPELEIVWNRYLDLDNLPYDAAGVAAAVAYSSQAFRRATSNDETIDVICPEPTLATQYKLLKPKFGKEHPLEFFTRRQLEAEMRNHKGDRNLASSAAAKKLHARLNVGKGSEESAITGRYLDLPVPGRETPWTLCKTPSEAWPFLPVSGAVWGVRNSEVTRELRDVSKDKPTIDIAGSDHSGPYFAHLKPTLTLV